MSLKDSHLLNIRALNLDREDAEVVKEKEDIGQMIMKTDELEKMLQILKLNLHAENTEIRILLRQLMEKMNKVENKQEVTIEKLNERRGFLSRLKYLFSGF